MRTALSGPGFPASPFARIPTRRAPSAKARPWIGTTTIERQGALPHSAIRAAWRSSLYVAFEFPRFGDRVQSGTPITVRWRDTRVQSMTVVVSDLDSLDPTGEPTIVKTRKYPAEGAVNFALQTATAQFAALFGATGPQDGRRYRVGHQLCQGWQQRGRRRTVPHGNRSFV